MEHEGDKQCQQQQQQQQASSPQPAASPDQARRGGGWGPGLGGGDTGQSVVQCKQASSRGFPKRVYVKFSVSQGEAREPRFSQIELDPPGCGAAGWDEGGCEVNNKAERAPGLPSHRNGKGFRADRDICWLLGFVQGEARKRDGTAEGE